MATPYMGCLFCLRRCNTTPRTGGGRDNHQTYPRKGEGDLTPPRDHATALVTTPRTGGDLTPPRDRTTALASNLRIFAAAQKILRKMLQFQENFLLLFSESK